MLKASTINWGILFSHPSDFTPVCTTELGAMAKIYPDFEKHNIRVIALSCNSLESHKMWIKDIIAFNDLRMNDLPFPIISDEKRELAVQLGMLDPNRQGQRRHTAHMQGGTCTRLSQMQSCSLGKGYNVPAVRDCVFIIAPDKKLKLSMLYPATSGRNFPELFRAVASLKLTEEKKPGEPCMVIPSVKDEEIPLLFPKGVTSYNVPSGRKYIRVTPQPDP
ncbi:hypothetical protein MTO96_005745 [Rhipicephalus appendiculatus]